MQRLRKQTAAFLFRHVLLIPGGLAALAVYSGNSGLDQQLADRLFDPISGSFPARAWAGLEMFGHHFAKSAVYVFWFVLFLAAIGASVSDLGWNRGLRSKARILQATVLGMASGPCLVVWLKGLNAHRCPWDLKAYGGYADLASAWFVSSAEVGHCFPGGHASAGFSLAALYFAGVASRNSLLAKTGLLACLATGVAFSFIRMAQGAHFLSHNLWSAAICWAAAALAFLPLQNSEPPHLAGIEA